MPPIERDFTETTVQLVGVFLGFSSNLLCFIPQLYFTGMNIDLHHTREDMIGCAGKEELEALSKDMSYK